ncbi:DUF6950 family protein [Methylobacterium sp. Leaf399]|uniref:DUF6950 family protein n=1 Tax=Methylobacterium sp. Leaf399 TaxID=1736364 RepID=UPI000A9D313E|nr:hypothetical protein [Methylobacterium sp. Leaf399]
MATPFDRAAGADCAMWVADWVKAETGTDPAAALRGTYASAFGAARQIARFGGYEIMWRVCMAVAGFNTTRDPQNGDVGVVIDAAGNTVSAIRFDGQWAAKSEGGVVIEDFRMLVAWSLSRG